MRHRALLAACFAAILGFVACLAGLAPAWRHLDALLPLWLLAGAAWCAAIWLARDGRLPLLAVVAGALVLRALALTSWPDLSDDINRYVWEGELLSRGISPFAFAPDHDSLAQIANELGELHSKINHPSVSAAYPPVTQAACALVMALEQQLAVGAVFLMRAFFALCDLLVIWPMAVLLRRAGKPVGLAVAWAWSPLVVAEFAGSGHFDSLGILLLLGALAILTGKDGSRRLPGQALLAAAILVKYIPVLALPYALRGRGLWKRGLTVLALVVAGFLPVLWLEGGTQGLFAGLGNYGLRWQSFGLVHPTFAAGFDAVFPQDGGWLDSRRLVRICLFSLLLLSALWAWRKPVNPVRATGLLLGMFLVLSPTLHPWYVTWVVPFIPFGGSRPWLWLVLTVPLTYTVLPGWKLDGVWELSPWIRAGIAVPVLLLLFSAFRPDSIESRRP